MIVDHRGGEVDATLLVRQSARLSDFFFACFLMFLFGSGLARVLDFFPIDVYTQHCVAFSLVVGGGLGGGGIDMT